MLGDGRRKQLLNRIESAGTLSNAEAAAGLQVSMLTIRRDLEILERDGLIRRVYGGAQHISLPGFAPPSELEFTQRQVQHREVKARIAQMAADTISNGETVFLDAGTTTLALASAICQLPLRKVLIVTHAVNIANEFANHQQFKVLVIGGELFEETRACTGQVTLDSVRRYHYDRFFLGCSGFDVQNGITNARLPEVEIKNAVIERSNWVCLLTDSSKWGINSFAPIAPLERCHTVITDAHLQLNAQRKIRQLGLELRLA